MVKRNLIILFSVIYINLYSQENVPKHSLVVGFPITFSKTTILKQHESVDVYSKFFVHSGIRIDYCYRINRSSSFEIGYLLHSYKVGYNYTIHEDVRPIPNNFEDYEKISYKTFSIPVKYCYRIYSSKRIFSLKIGYEYVVPLIIDTQFSGLELYDESLNANMEYLRRDYYPQKNHMIHAEFGIEKRSVENHFYYAAFVNYGLKNNEVGYYKFYPESEDESFGLIYDRGSYIGVLIAYTFTFKKQAREI